MSHFTNYSERLQNVLATADWSNVEVLSNELLSCWKEGRQVFLCGNGGSTGNAIHIANDLIYGVSKTFGSGIRVNALSVNAATLTCLANDTGFDNVFSHQLAVQAAHKDILIVFSGSGNSPNVLRALEVANEIGMKTFGILGYDGGKAKELANVVIHFAVDDMQISEDMQLITCHMIMQWLYDHHEEVTSTPSPRMRD